jgi:microcystin-dependent protein
MRKIAFAAAATAALISAGAASAQEAFVSQIMPMAGKSCPRGWKPADGSLLQIAQDRVLYGLIGTTYGGDGKTTFALPNLKGGTIGPAAQPITWCFAINGIYPPPSN